MADIVDRIRSIAQNEERQVVQDALYEVADTVEHLRKMLENLMAVGGNVRPGPDFREITKDLRRTGPLLD